MNLIELQRKLLAAARSNPPSDRVPYAFEKRVIAHLQGRPRLDEWALWGSALWRATAPCIAIMVLLCAWSLLAPMNHPPASDLSQDFENTVFAAVDQEPSTDSLW